MAKRITVIDCKKCSNTRFVWIGDNESGHLENCTCGDLSNSILHPITRGVLEKSLLRCNYSKGDSITVHFSTLIIIDNTELQQQLDLVKNELLSIIKSVDDIKVKKGTYKDWINDTIVLCINKPEKI